jgi:hypothetical protein
VPECETLQTAKFDSEWVKDVLPGSITESYGHFVPETCTKYVYNDSLVSDGNACAAQDFQHQKMKCDQWVFEEGDKTIVNEVSWIVLLNHGHD